MKKEFLIKSLNVNGAEALTIEKAEDRIEFEALMSLNGESDDTCDDKCTVVCDGFGTGPSCDPMDPGPVPTVPDPTPFPCPELK